MKAKKAQEEYPIRFKDSIDEYLCKEHHILAGCCSSTETLKYDVAREVAEKLSNVLIDKAAKWINEHTSLSEKLVIENFVNYMKGE